MKRRIAALASAVAASLLAAGCASEPAYPPPTGDEAREAYVRAIRADWIDRPAPQPPQGETALVPGDSPDEAGRKVFGVLDYESEMNTRAMAPGLIASLDKVVLGQCEWGGLDAADVKHFARHRIEGAVSEGYGCDYRVFHQTESRGLVSAAGEGYFFHRDGSYDFAKVDEESFEEVRSRQP